MSNFSTTEMKICASEHEVRYIESGSNEQTIEEIASNPIFVYKLIKEMNWFYDAFYVTNVKNATFETGNL